MKIIKRIAATLALCGTAFFTNMVYAGDCGTWETEGYWVTTNVEILGSGSVPPASGPGTPVFITTGATYTPLSCGGPPDDGNSNEALPDGERAKAAYRNAIRTEARFCKKAAESCDDWSNRRRANPCSTEPPGYQNYCTTEVGKENFDNSCSTVSTCSN